jgi:hypothetical protein
LHLAAPLGTVADTMKKAFVLILGLLVYVAFLDTGKRVADREMLHLQYLYTSAGAQAAAISSASR